MDHVDQEPRGCMCIRLAGLTVSLDTRLGTVAGERIPKEEGEGTNEVGQEPQGTTVDRAAPLHLIYAGRTNIGIGEYDFEIHLCL